MIRPAAYCVCLLMSLLLLAEMLPAQAAGTVGQVTRTQGQSMTVANGDNRALAQGAVVAQDETLVTLKDSRLAVRLIDGTELTLGENARLRVNSLVFNQAERSNQLALFAEGAFRIFTGKIREATGASVQLNTPVAVLSIRGTDVWGGPIDGAYGVFLVEGIVEVRTAVGQITLTEPGTGTNITDAASAPSPVASWSQDKVERALGSVAFR